MQQETITLNDKIDTAIATTEIGSKARRKALLAIKWALRSTEGQYAGLSGLDCVLTTKDGAQVFSGMDNEETKRRFWQAQLGTTLLVEVL